MAAYRAQRDAVRRPILDTYTILGFLSSGTYGRVYKARLRHTSNYQSTSSSRRSGHGGGDSHTSRERDDGEVFAIKKFKPDKESELIYTGISQSAMREIALINGVAYLHANWVLHRDLKPANILVTSSGRVKIGDLGLARLYSAPLQPLYTGDKVVVTIWYRAPELLLGAKHYTPAIDMWAIGCIWGELLALRPMFKGEEAKIDPKNNKSAPFQADQLKRIVEILGTPTSEQWPALEAMPEYKGWWPHLQVEQFACSLPAWYAHRAKSRAGLALFEALLQYDPANRLTAAQALEHPWFTTEDPPPTLDAFATLPNPRSTYPSRRVVHDESDPKMSSSAVVAANAAVAQTASAAVPVGANR
ncbi:cyclin-dependent protein kinase [Tilletia horrida]|uniref:Cyclin-dependent kinase 8 n=1 Tax=Tilletia horrida TaxID=155126 RepID=A0AAN6GKS8_9BASI|nr:cyclin-dependent protein kinase [Tilletia horrida]KAK0561269.1 cyclin-dependent protein kinase [Tilletia horrida]